MDNYEIPDREILESIQNWDSNGLTSLVEKYKANIVERKMTDLKKRKLIFFDADGTTCWLSQEGKEYLLQLKADE